jgi:multicomponent Na+:H+ antiporter subunit E
MPDASTTMTGTPEYVGRHLKRIALRALLFTGLWWGLTEGAVDSWTVGIPAVIGATLASYSLRSKRTSRWNLKGVIVFAGFFVFESLRAGVDVAWRALTLNIAPQIIEYESSLTDEKALTLFCATVSLLPGTLTTEIRERTLMIHTLDSRQPVREELRRLEWYINAMLSNRSGMD